MKVVVVMVVIIVAVVIVAFGEIISINAAQTFYLTV